MVALIAYWVCWLGAGVASRPGLPGASTVRVTWLAVTQQELPGASGAAPHAEGGDVGDRAGAGRMSRAVSLVCSTDVADGYLLPLADPGGGCRGPASSLPPGVRGSLIGPRSRFVSVAPPAALVRAGVVGDRRLSTA